MTMGEAVAVVVTWLRKTAINASLALTSLAAACLLGEGATRLVAPQQLVQVRSDLWQPADTIGYVHRPNVAATINTGERTVDIFTDARGFRVGGEGARESGTPVLLIGDSFMDALQVQYEQSLAALLQEHLSDETGAPVAVRNAGVDGWSPSHYLIRARMLLPRDNYRLVVTTLYVANDAEPRRVDYFAPRPHAVRYGFRLPRRLEVAELVDALLRPVNDGLEVRSHLFTLLKNRLQTLRMRLGLYPLDFPTEFLRSEAMAERWSLTAEICRDIRDVAEKHGAKAIFVLIPAAYQVDPDQFTSYLRGFGVDPATVDLNQPSRRLYEELSALGLTVLDALPAFRAAYDAGEVLYGTIDPHFTPAGHELLADLLLPLASELLVR